MQIQALRTGDMEHGLIWKNAAGEVQQSGLGVPGLVSEDLVAYLHGSPYVEAGKYITVVNDLIFEPGLTSPDAAFRFVCHEDQTSTQPLLLSWSGALVHREDSGYGALGRSSFLLTDVHVMPIDYFLVTTPSLPPSGNMSLIVGFSDSNAAYGIKQFWGHMGEVSLEDGATFYTAAIHNIPRVVGWDRGGTTKGNLIRFAAINKESAAVTPPEPVPWRLRVVLGGIIV
jgi:hypothetical protein